MTSAWECSNDLERVSLNTHHGNCLTSDKECTNDTVNITAFLIDVAQKRASATYPVPCQDSNPGTNLAAGRGVNHLPTPQP